MVKEIINNIKNIEKNILKIMFKGFKFCFGILIISSIVLLFYILNPVSYIIFDSGIILFKTSLTYAVCFFICAFVSNNIKKEIN